MTLRVAPLAFAGLLLLTGSANAQTIASDRPDFTDGTSVVPRRTVQAEIGFGRTASGDVNSDQILGTLLRFALGNSVEARVGWAGVNRLSGEVPETTSGSGDISFGTKIQLGQQRGWLPAASVMGTLTLPSGADEFRVAEEVPEARLLLGWGIRESYGLSLNLGSNWSAVGDESKARTDFYSASVGRSAGQDYSVFVEFFGLLAPDGAGDAQYVDVGVLFLARENVQVDVYGGMGVSGDTSDSFFGAGVSYRFPR